MPAPDPATFRPDPARYLAAHAAMAVALGALAGGVLVVMGNPDPWVGPVAGVLAVGLRAAYLRSKALAEVWTLTATHLAGPEGRQVPLATLARATPFAGSVVLVTRAGDKHQIKYLVDPAAAAARIRAAAGL
jgi:hypothetical protein